MTGLNIPSQPLPIGLEAEFRQDYAIASARGNRKALSSLSIEFVRELTEEDLPELRNPSKLATAASPVVKELKSSHHRLAQLLAQGHHHAEVSLLTGYSEGYISRMLDDSAFKSLMKHYAVVDEIKHTDVVERMRSLGIDAMEELQKRLAEHPEEFSIRETQELMELTLLKPMAIAAERAKGGGGGSGASPVINISFRAAGVAQVGQVIDGELVSE